MNEEKKPDKRGRRKMPALLPSKKSGLTPEKKAGLKQIMGKYSGKASLSLIREICKNESNKF